MLSAVATSTAHQAGFSSGPSEQTLVDWFGFGHLMPFELEEILCTAATIFFEASPEAAFSKISLGYRL